MGTSRPLKMGHLGEMRIEAPAPQLQIGPPTTIFALAVHRTAHFWFKVWAHSSGCGFEHYRRSRNLCGHHTAATTSTACRPAVVRSRSVACVSFSVGHRHHQAHHPQAPQPFLFLEGVPSGKGYLWARDTFVIPLEGYLWQGIPLAVIPRHCARTAKFAKLNAIAILMPAPF